MNDFSEFSNDIKELLASKKNLDAQKKIQDKMIHKPVPLKLFLLATDVYRASGDRDQSFKYAKEIISYYPKKWHGYARATQDLVALKRLHQARTFIEDGLRVLPNHPSLLIIAADLHRAMINPLAALQTYEALITYHPGNWHGYGRSVQDLIILSQFDKARTRLSEALKKFPDEAALNYIAADSYRALGEHENLINCLDKLVLMDCDLPRQYQSAQLSKVSAHHGWQGSQLQVCDAIEFGSNLNFILSRADMPFNMMYAPKNACTSLKNTLLREKIPNAGAHSKANIYLKQSIDFSKEFIALTRNPFKRFLSAFSDKVGPNKDPNVWKNLCERYGFNRDKAPPMTNFLDYLLQDDINLIDGHFRPQSSLFCSSSITPTYIFRLERMEDFVAYLRSFNYSWKNYSRHSTISAAISPQQLKPKISEKISKLYEKDFVIYDYSFDPSETHIKPNTVRYVQQISGYLTKSAQACESQEYQQASFPKLILSLYNEYEPEKDEEFATMIAKYYLNLR